MESESLKESSVSVCDSNNESACCEKESSQHAVIINMRSRRLHEGIDHLFFRTNYFAFEAAADSGRVAFPAAFAFVESDPGSFA